MASCLFTIQLARTGEALHMEFQATPLDRLQG
jgi:hypothetical protein